MGTKRKYPKSFKDDGLDDILECVDDILESSENLLKRKDEDRKSIREKKSKRDKKKVNLYGDNEITNDNKYKPPKKVQYIGLDHTEEFKDDNKVDVTLDRRARGLINKLAAQTMPFVATEFEKLYSNNPRASIDQAIFNNIETSVIQKNAMAKRKLVAELMLLVSYLNYKISLSIGASLVHRLIQKLEEILIKIENYEDDKRPNNILCCIANLYTINLIGSNVMFEVTKRICSSTKTYKQIELLLVVIKNIGFQLRKDNPKIISQLINMINQSNYSSLSSESDDSRIKFVVTELEECATALKNNNINKISNYGCDIDKDVLESTLKTLIHRTKLAECLGDATYEDILNSPNWYLLETRINEQDDKKVLAKEKSKVSDNLTNKKELKICKALGLNKPSERVIFGRLIKATDYNEASNNLIGLGFNHSSDAMLVCIHVAIHEKNYNTFYYNLINTLCKFNRKYKLAAKFSIQDKIRTLGGMKQERVEIFKRLCFDLIQSDAIPITILKAIEWADISSSTKEFLEYLLKNISDLPDEERRKIIMKADKKSIFGESMRAFISCFMKGCKLFN